MFTGLVHHCGIVKSVTTGQKNIQISLETTFTDLKLGESIAVDGVCLTVTSFSANVFTVDVSPETARVTTLGHCKQGSQVNLERAMLLTDRLGGHFVTGHVDGQCQLLDRHSENEYVSFTIGPIPKTCRKYLVKKGSIAINGVSLTLNEVFSDRFQVMLIPHTLAITNLDLLQAGDPVNIEYDYLAKLVGNFSAEFKQPHLDVIEE